METMSPGVALCGSLRWRSTGFLPCTQVIRSSSNGIGSIDRKVESWIVV